MPKAAAAKKPPAKPPKPKPKADPPSPQIERKPAIYGGTIEHDVSLERLHVDPTNARRHPERNMQTIVASLRANKQVEPLVAQLSSGRIIGGNGRYEAMRLLGWSHCTVSWVDISDAAATALGITLNRSAEQAEWDLDVLDKLTTSLGESGVAMMDIGFNEEELDKLIGEVKDADNFEPSDNDPDRLDELAPVECPNCHHRFAPEK